MPIDALPQRAELAAPDRSRTSSAPAARTPSSCGRRISRICGSPCSVTSRWSCSARRSSWRTGRSRSSRCSPSARRASRWRRPCGRAWSAKKQRNNLHRAAQRAPQGNRGPWGQVPTYVFEDGLRRVASDFRELTAALAAGDAAAAYALYREPLAPGIEFASVDEERGRLHEEVGGAALRGQRGHRRRGRHPLRRPRAGARAAAPGGAPALPAPARPARPPAGGAAQARCVRRST